MVATCKLGPNGCWNDGKCRTTSNCENKMITNADKIRDMTDRQLAEWIYDKAMLSESVCCYCEHYHKRTCNDGVCQNMTDIEIIMTWLQQPMEEK